MSTAYQRWRNDPMGGGVVVQPRPSMQPRQPQTVPAPVLQRTTDTPLARMAARHRAAGGGAQIEQQREEEQSSWGRGLGVVLNNPVTRFALQPIEQLDKGRRLLTMAAEGFVENVGSTMLGQEVDLNPGDDRDFWDKLNDPTYGVGQLVGDVSWDDSLGNFFDRGVGFTGDVLLDPLTYVAGIGLATKGGTALSKGVRAGMARSMLDKGVSEASVRNFVRRGAGSLSGAERELAGVGRAGVRAGTRNHNVVIPGTERLGTGASRALGAAGDKLRNTRAGGKVAAWRTPERIEDAYGVMFGKSGAMDFGTAAERVQMENTWRAAQNTFRGVHDRSTRDVRKQSRKLSDEQRREVLQAIETGAVDQIQDSAARDVAKRMSQAFDEMWSDAKPYGARKMGVSAGRRNNYAPHILTRDAAKWVRNAGSEAKDARGLVTVSTFDESGVTMGRRLTPGQKLEVNGQEVTLDGATIHDVNEKFRAAGLDFDFYETDPAVILQKYINMLSSDVGVAQATIQRIGKGGGVGRLSDDEMRLLGLDVRDFDRAPENVGQAQAEGLWRASQDQPTTRVRAEEVDGKYVPAGPEAKPSDLDRIAAQHETGPLNSELLEAANATERRVRRDRNGQPILTAKGRAKQLKNRQAERTGDDLVRLDADDFEWEEGFDLTGEMHEKEAKRAKAGISENETRFGDTSQRLEKAIETARAAGEQGYTDVIEAQRSTLRQLKSELNAVIDKNIADISEAGELREWIAQVDDFMDSLDRSLRSLDGAVTKDVAAARQTAVKDKLRQLRQERESLRPLVEQIRSKFAPALSLGDMHRQRADDLAGRMYGPARRMEQRAEQFSQLGQEERRRLVTEKNNITTRIQNGDPDEALPNRLAEIDAQLNPAAATVGETPPELARRAQLEREIRELSDELPALTQAERRAETLAEAAKNPVRKGGKGGPHVVRTSMGDYKVHYNAKRKEWFIESPEGRADIQAHGTFRTMTEAIDAVDGIYVAETGRTSLWKANRNAKAMLPDAKEKARQASRRRKQIEKEIAKREGELGALPKGRTRQQDVESTRIDEGLSRQAAASRRLNEQEAVEGGLPNIESRVRGTASHKIDDPYDPLESYVPTDAEIAKAEELSQEMARRDKEIRAVDREITATRRGAARTQAVKNAKARLKNAKDRGKRARIQAEINQAQREAEESLGIFHLQERRRLLAGHHSAAEIERERLLTGRGKRSLDQPRTDAAAAVREAQGESNLDRLQYHQSQARQLPKVTTEKATEVVGRVKSIDEQLMDIVQSESAQARTVDEMGQAAGASRRRKQWQQRDDIDRAKDWGGAKIGPRRQQYVERVRELDEAVADGMERKAEAVSSVEAAEAALADVQQKLRDYNMRSTGEIKDGKLVAPAAPTTGKGSEQYAAEVRSRIEEISSVIDDQTLPPEVRAAIAVTLDEANDLSKVVDSQIVTAQARRKIRDDAQSGKLGRIVQVQLANGWSPAFPNIVGNDIVMSEALQKSMNRVMEATFHKDFWPFIDAFTNLFKTYATATPGFHLRNAMSAAFMNAADGVSMPQQLESIKLFRRFRQATNPEEWLAKQPEDVQQAFAAAFGSGIGGRYTEPGIGQRGSARYRAQEKAFDNTFTRVFGEMPGANVEGAARLAPALDTIRRGGSVDDALSRVTRLHFDYSQMSAFDKNARRLIPFWTFMSRNLPLQLSQMYTKPRTYAKYNSFIRNIQGERDPNEPDYFKSVGAFPVGAQTLGGLPLYLQPDFAHSRLDEDYARYEAALSGNNVGQVLSDFTPLITAPLEYVTDTNLYTGRKYQDDDMRSAGTLEAPYALLARLLGQSEKTPEGNVAYSEKFLDTMRSLNPLYDRTVRLLPQYTEGQNSDSGSRQMESWARFMGLPIRQLSPEQQLATQRSRFYDQLDQDDIDAALMEIDKQMAGR